MVRAADQAGDVLLEFDEEEEDELGDIEKAELERLQEPEDDDSSDDDQS
jgi:hypothetical protein